MTKLCPAPVFIDLGLRSVLIGVACPAQDDEVFIEFTTAPFVGEVVNIEVLGSAAVETPMLSYRQDPASHQVPVGCSEVSPIRQPSEVVGIIAAFGQEPLA